jgi:hypothetical protein
MFLRARFAQVAKKLEVERSNEDADFVRQQDGICLSKN